MSGSPGSSASADPSRDRRAVAMLPVRWSGLAMALALAVGGHPVEAAVAMLVALAQVCTWRVRQGPAWEIAVTIIAMVAALSSYLRLYERWPWWDLPVHMALTGVLAVIAARLIRREGAVWITGSGLVLSVVWEVLELWGHARIDPAVHVAPVDTAGDIAAGLVGAAVAAMLRRRTAGHPIRPATPGA